MLDTFPFMRLSAGACAAVLLVTSCASGNGAETDEAGATEGTIPAPDISGSTDEAQESSADSGDQEDSGNQDHDSSDDDGAESSADADPEWPAANTTLLTGEATLTEPAITPKSIVANGHGLAIANNMLYQNTVTIYDTESHELVQELSDTISPAEFGIEGYPDQVSGAPVEAVWTEDGQYAYVSQYRLAGLGADAEDFCQAGDAIAESAVYRYSVEEEDWDQFIEVGRIPKYVELTPNGEQLLVSNWCDHDLSVVDVDSAEEIMRIPLNSQPRGIVVMDDNRTAYVTAMFAHEVYKVDLETGDSEVVLTTGQRPRHLVRDAEGENIYITVAGANELLRFDPATDEVTATAATGAEPRTMTISEDGTALYVVNYEENSLSKFDAETFEEIQRVNTDSLPIGVTYDSQTASVWVANYSGSVNVFDDHSASR